MAIQHERTHSVGNMSYAADLGSMRHGMVLYKFNCNTSPSWECRAALTRTQIFVTESPWSPFSITTFPATGLVVVEAYCAQAPESTRHCATAPRRPKARGIALREANSLITEFSAHSFT